ncbi:hypothetical protein BSK67_18265 [Paenibacillus odorifer]|nr:hypothetical protein BSK67_18265 [Paenibacillus odorifer]
MGEFWLAMLYLFLMCAALLVVVILLQLAAKKIYHHTLKKHGESSIFLRKFYEIDSWELMCIFIVISFVIYYFVK